MDERGQQRPVRGGLVRSESTTVRFPRDWFFATPAARHRGPIWWHRVSAGGAGATSTWRGGVLSATAMVVSRHVTNRTRAHPERRPASAWPPSPAVAALMDRRPTPHEARRGWGGVRWGCL